MSAHILLLSRDDASRTESLELVLTATLIMGQSDGIIITVSYRTSCDTVHESANPHMGLSQRGCGA
jgi:hypothetical protein